MKAVVCTKLVRLIPASLLCLPVHPRPRLFPFEIADVPQPDAEVQEVPFPTPAEGEVIVKVHYASAVSHVRHFTKIYSISSIVSTSSILIPFRVSPAYSCRQSMR